MLDLCLSKSGCSGLKPAGGKQFLSVSREASVLSAGAALGLMEEGTEARATPHGHGVCPPLSQPCPLLSQTVQALPLKRTMSFTPVALSQPAEDLPVCQGRSCHLPSSLNSFLANSYKCVFVPVPFSSFTLGFFLSMMFTRSPGVFIDGSGSPDSFFSPSRRGKLSATPCSRCSKRFPCPQTAS